MMRTESMIAEGLTALSVVAVAIATCAVVLALFGCGGHKPGPEPVPVAATQADRDAWRASSARLVSWFWDGHCVISRDANGGPQALGDCLIWKGLALAALPCELGDQLELAIIGDLERLGGALERAPSLPGQVSIDGLLGFYRGAADRMTRCGRVDAWRPALALHAAYLASHGGLPNAGQGDVHITDGGTDAVLAAVLAIAGGPAPDRLRLDTVGAELVNGWAAAVEASVEAWQVTGGAVPRVACYRVHLGYEAARTLEIASYPIRGQDRDGYCGASAAFNLPLTDHFCGRGDLVSWTRAFQPDLYEFRHQRCPDWESPDGDGFGRPGLDEALALREAFNF